jgi:hypothetical protein
MLTTILAAALVQPPPQAERQPRRVDFYCNAMTVAGAPFSLAGRQDGGTVELSRIDGTPLEGFTFRQVDNGMPGVLSFSGHVRNVHHRINLALDPWSSQTPTVLVTRSAGMHDSRSPISVATGFCSVRVNGREGANGTARVRRP